MVDVPRKFRGLTTFLSKLPIGHEVRIVHVGPAPSFWVYRDETERFAREVLTAYR